jgi:hypothetical protein
MSFFSKHDRNAPVVFGFSNQNPSTQVFLSQTGLTTMTRVIQRCIFGVFLLGFSMGCGDGKLEQLPVANVSGTVKLDDKPIENGNIIFSTDGRPPQIIPIRSGAFSGTAMVGQNKVQISAKRASATAGRLSPQILDRMKSEQANAAKNPNATQPPAGMSGAGGGEEETIPAVYNSMSKETRVVESGGANKFDFVLSSKAK